MTVNEAQNALKELQLKTYAYKHAMNMIYYDSVTAAPGDTAEGRGEALGILSGEAYRLTAGEETGELLNFLTEKKAEIGFQRAREVELLKREYDRDVKIPKDEYVVYRKLLNESENVWQRAKVENNFAAFAPYIEKIVETQKRFSAYICSGLDPYDDMLDRHERGMRRASLDKFFEVLRKTIVPLVIEIIKSGTQPDDGFLYRRYPAEGQRAVAKYLMGVMGIDEKHCALGETLHPFTLEFNKKDVRITTNYHENMLHSSIYSVIHEGGHALYELNIGDELQYTCAAEGVSMGIHESQSRLYENIIGRSRAFIGLILPKLKSIFPEQLDGVTAEAFYRAVNKSVPSLIRTEADELTYCLHVMVRYEIEKALFDGSVRVADLPEVWNLKMREYLGVEVPDNARGVLQDSHWSGGDFGYFPSYAVGSAYSAQIAARMRKEVDIEACVSSGDLRTITAWLTDKIYRYGRLYDPSELLERCCGEPFDPSYYTRYLSDKFSELYGL